MELLRSLIQDLENGKKSAYQMRNLIQQLQGSDGGDEFDHPDRDDQYYYKGFNDHTMVVLSTFDNALSKLQACHLSNETTKVEYNDTSKSTSNCKSDEGLTTPKYRRGCHKRRKIGQSASVIIVPNLTDDGHAWRKYGQKDILNSKYPRNYYRCTHKFEQGCQATKQVQQITTKPDQYKVIYQGEHTCKTIVIKTPPLISHHHDNQDSSFSLNFSDPISPKHALNPLIFSSSLSPSPLPSPLPSPSPSSSPFAMVKREFNVPTKYENQSGSSDCNLSSDLTSTSTAASDQGDVISSSIDVQGFYSSSVAYHGMDNEQYSNMMDDFSVFDDVMIQDILCV